MCCPFCTSPIKLAAGMPWPNPACPVTMVECESGREEQSAGAGGAAVAHGSYHNVEEAKLAVRCAGRAPLLPAHPATAQHPRAKK